MPNKNLKHFSHDHPLICSTIQPATTFMAFWGLHAGLSVCLTYSSWFWFLSCLDKQLWLTAVG